MTAFVCVLKLLLGTLLMSSAFAFMATPRYVGVRHAYNPIKPTPATIPVGRRMALQIVRRGSIFGGKRRNQISFIRRKIRSILHCVAQNKRKKMAALAFALSVWLRGIPSQEVPSVHAATTVEQVRTNIQIEGGSTEALDVSEEAQSRAILTPKTERTGLNRKIAVTGTVIMVPSAGILVARSQKKKENSTDATNDGSSSTGEEKNPAEKFNPTDEDNANIVQSVLDRAKRAQEGISAEEYMKKLPKDEEFEGTLSIANGKTEKVADDSSEKSSSTVVVDAVPTNSELPLMTHQFVEARQQPKSQAEERLLRQKYQSISDIGDRAFAILVDLGMIETDDSSVSVGLPVAVEEEPFQ